MMMSENKISTTDEKALKRKYKKDEMSYIQLEYGITDESALNLARILRKKKNSITGLFLDCKISKFAIKEIFHSLRNSKTLRTIEMDLEENLSQDGLEAVFEKLKTFRNLKDLSICSTCISGLALSHLAAALNNEKIKNISINNCILHNTSIGPLCESLSKNNSLEDLDLYGVELTSLDLILLANSLRANKALLHLTLFQSSFDVDAARAFAYSLEVSNIETLDLSCCNLGSNGLAELSDSFTSNKIIKLILIDNEISDLDAQSIAKILASKKLKYLDLGENDLELEGYKIILEAMKNNTILTHLEDSNLYYNTNEFMKSIGAEIELILTRNKEILGKEEKLKNLEQKEKFKNSQVEKVRSNITTNTFKSDNLSKMFHQKLNKRKWEVSFLLSWELYSFLDDYTKSQVSSLRNKNFVKCKMLDFNSESYVIECDGFRANFFLKNLKLSQNW